LLEVIEQATDNRADERAEIWSEDLGKVGVVEPLPVLTPTSGRNRA
jgi:hypothetical protein